MNEIRASRGREEAPHARVSRGTIMAPLNGRQMPICYLESGHRFRPRLVEARIGAVVATVAFCLYLVIIV